MSQFSEIVIADYLSSICHEPLTTGLEDYGLWKAMFKDHKRESNLPSRRGRIWS
ncbi:MAG: cyanobactin biosynthesis PatC/TenC/TruC family protein [Symploca sp. SIO1C4]|uniref:Cyanobactin biosynthesis PatC/TenC/TruC family protein n=1 Tax=Symploca sp. SIO1C4 TaxID=2607765 RepID=A0A6B3NIN2_9CYAN|nr:cyanobactin biosynthesis PatC/TenC/TruC family protein [Symploca sp. SIO1C4]